MLTISRQRSTSEPSELPVREFRLGAEYRRCAWYVVLGSACTVSVAGFLRLRGLVVAQGGWTTFVLGGAAILAAAFGLVFVAYRWKLRVDHMGIARRQLWNWDLWSWDEFQSGKIKRHGDCFLSFARPWWRNGLTFGLLEDGDRKFLLAACKFFFQPTEEQPCQPLPGSISLRYQLFCTVTFREDGVSGRDGRSNFELGWSDVKQVRLLYFDHWSPDLCQIELDLPNRTLRIEAPNTITTPGQRTQRVVNHKVIPSSVAHFLKTCVSSEKLAKYALHGPPETLSEYDYRCRKLRRALRNFAWANRIVPPAMWILSLLCLSPKFFAVWQGRGVLPNPGWLVLESLIFVAIVTAQPLMFWALLHAIIKPQKTALHDLEVWKAAHSIEGQF